MQVLFKLYCEHCYSQEKGICIIAERQWYSDSAWTIIFPRISSSSSFYKFRLAILLLNWPIYRCRRRQYPSNTVTAARTELHERNYSVSLIDEVSREILKCKLSNHGRLKMGGNSDFSATLWPWDVAGAFPNLFTK